MSNFRVNNADISSIVVSSIYGTLLTQSIALINTLDVFKVIDVIIEDNKVFNTPACFILPTGIENIERNISGNLFINEYSCTIGVALKDATDNTIIAQMLTLEQMIRRLFAVDSSSRTPMVFSALAGHVDTRIDKGFPEPIAELQDNVLLYNTGINIIYTVHESY
jgi:hypothetical protein